MLDGLKVYFDVALGKMLLYRFERQQYVQIRKENGKDSKMSDIYGTEHLLRLLGNFFFSFQNFVIFFYFNL